MSPISGLPSLSAVATMCMNSSTVQGRTRPSATGMRGMSSKSVRQARGSLRPRRVHIWERKARAARADASPDFCQISSIIICMVSGVMAAAGQSHKSGAFLRAASRWHAPSTQRLLWR